MAGGIPGREVAPILDGKRICVVLPAYNAAATIARTVAEIDRTIVDDIVLVDDASPDETAAVSASLGLHTLRHRRNAGYGANQKTCYATALARGADVVVMLHPDYQYTPRLVVPMAAMVVCGVYDAVLGSRILGRGALAGGMPLWKYVANRGLTLVENVLLGIKLSEYHTGYRAVQPLGPDHAEPRRQRGRFRLRQSDDRPDPGGGVPHRRGVVSDALRPRFVVHRPALQPAVRAGRAGDRGRVPDGPLGVEALPVPARPRPRRCRGGRRRGRRDPASGRYRRVTSACRRPGPGIRAEAAPWPQRKHERSGDPGPHDAFEP